jgi:hypothetical protein
LLVVVVPGLLAAMVFAALTAFLARLIVGPAPAARPRGRSGAGSAAG